MELKLNFRLPQSVDRQTAFQTGLEDELRARLQLMGTPGIVSVSGKDVDVDTAACALAVNVNDEAALDVRAGMVVFANGEQVVVGASDILAIPISALITDAQLVRLQYGEVQDGTSEINPFDGYTAQPKTRKQTPREMLVIETVTAYNAQPAAVKALSVVLGVARYTDGLLGVDNSRATYTFSRPWFSPVDVTHRSYLGTGVKTATNPHANTFNDFSVGSYSAWHALVGQPAAVLARPTGFGRIPGTVCTETIPAGNFLTDATGLITGCAGALYAFLGFWPERLLSAARSADGTPVAAWVPRGRNVLAVFDPVDFGSAQNLLVYYTKVDAGAMPGSVLGATTITFSDPNANEQLVAGGNFFSALNEKVATFTDVGLVPMPFDVLVDGAGKVYKSPECVYCNTKLDTLGAGPATFTIQPRVPTRLRIAISNYNPGFTQVQLQITGTNEAGSSVTEQVTFNGPLPAPATAYVENQGQRLFTVNVFATLTQLQVIVRNNDGPNTTVTVFAEYSPQRPGQQDDLLLASVFWTGSEVSTAYALSATAVLDRRLVTRGGGARGLTAVDAALNQPGLVETSLGGPAGTDWATIVEDFTDPMWIQFPQADASATTPIPGPIELPANSLGIRQGYVSRRIPFAQALPNPLTAAYLRMLPGPSTRYPASVIAFTVTVTLYRTTGAPVVLTGILGTSAYPPFEVTLAGGPLPAGSYYAMQISIPRNADLTESFQGFLFHARG